MVNLLDHANYTVAWIAVLPIEAQAAVRVLDKQHDGLFPSTRSDDYSYIGGEVGSHNVVIATLPEGQSYGVGSAAALASQIKSRFPNIWFALLVGVAAGLPNLSSDDPSRRKDIRLGDVLVCVPDRGSTGIIQYDLGHDTDDGFLVHGRQADIPTVIRSAIGRVRHFTEQPFRSGNKLAETLSDVMKGDSASIFVRPPNDSDQLHETQQASGNTPSYISREARNEAEPTRIWYGRIGSGNTLMRSSRRRDELRDKHNLIGLEMEAAGVANVLPSGIVRGVCDYADNSKSKLWQPYAAIVAAVYAKHILTSIQPQPLVRGSATLPLDRPKRIFIPFRRDVDFVDRSDILDQIHQACTQPGGRIALLGLGGAGKSQLAIEYAYRIVEQDPHRWVFWIHAGTVARWEQDFRRIAETLKLPGLDDPQANVSHLVSQWLQDERSGKWTLILDNADDPGMFENQGDIAAGASSAAVLAFIPQSSHGSILATTRSRAAALCLVGRSQDIVKVDSMDEDLALALLRAKLDKWPVAKSELDQAPMLVRALDYWPLAITQAAAYVNRLSPRSSISKYMDRFQQDEKNRMSLLNDKIVDLRRDATASNSVLRTWQISFEHIRAIRSTAADLLSLMSCCDRHGIPDFMLLAYTRRTKQAQRTGEGDEEDFDELTRDEFDQDIAILNDYCMVWISENGDLFQIHALVQLATHRWLVQQGDLGEWKHTMVLTLEQSLPPRAYSSTPILQLLLPQIEVAEQLECCTQDAELALASILGLGAWYTYSRGLYHVAERMLSKSTSIQRKLISSRDAAQLSSLLLQGLIQYSLYQYPEAENSFRQILQEAPSLSASKDEITLDAMEWLANVLMDSGRLLEGESLVNERLQLSRTIYGNLHARTLEATEQSAWLLSRRGDHEGAILLYRKALQGLKQAYTESDPTYSNWLANFASILLDSGDLQEAKTNLEDVVSIKGSILGQTHPEYLRAVSKLAKCLIEEGTDVPRAEELLKQILPLQQDGLGSDHFDSLATLQFLSHCLLKRSRYDEAIVIMRKTVELMGQKQGGYHVQVKQLHPTHGLALALRLVGNYEEAEHWYRETIAITTALLKYGEPTNDEIRRQHTNARFDLARILVNKRQVDEAVTLFQEVHDEFVELYGANHKYAKKCLKYLLCLQEEMKLTGLQNVDEMISHRNGGEEEEEEEEDDDDDEDEDEDEDADGGVTVSLDDLKLS